MDEVVKAVFGIAGLLGLASLLVPASKRLYLPYTVLLALGGGILGFFALNVGESTGPIADFLQALNTIDVSAETLLYVFLPPLLFAGGLTIDVRRLMDDIWPVLLLAIVGVLLCFLAVGWAVHLTSGQGLILCFLLGAIVATTDTAAVLNIFRDIGAPKRLSIIVEGESLFNDAAAIALFGVLLAMLITPAAPDVIGGFWALARGLVGGVIFGYVIARLVVAIIPFLRGAVLTEITLTVTLAYVTFVVAEAYFHVSGIIAVVAAAMTFSGEARTKLSPGTWDVLKAIWRQLDFWATTLIFVLAAMMAPRAVEGLTWAHGLALVALYLAAIAARAVVLFGLMPLLTRYKLAGHIDNRYKLVLLWGAMRGAITVALALTVAQKDDALTDEQRSFVWIMAVGFVLATLFINAPSLRFLMRGLKLDILDPHEKLIRDRVMELSRRRVNDQVRALAVEFGIPEMPELKVESKAGDNHVTLSHPDRLKVGLFAIANQEAELTLDYLERGMIDRHIADTLIAHAGRIVDDLKTHGSVGYTRGWRRSYAMTPRFRGSLWLQRRWGWTGPIAQEIADRFELLLVKERLLQDLVEFSRVRVVPIVGDDVAQDLDSVLRDRIQAIGGAIEGLDLQYPEYAASVRQLFLTRMCLGLEEAEYRGQLEQAMISNEVFEDLETDLRQRSGQLRTRPKLDLGLRLATMLAKVPLFTRLTQADLAELAKLLTPQIAVPDEKIIVAGDKGDRMYFIAAGEVEVAIRNPPIQLGPGDFVGEMALILDQPRNADVIARAYCNLLVLRRNDFERYVRAHPSIEREIEAVAKARYAANIKAA